MKRELKDELVALAEKITLLKEKDQVATGELKELAKRLYEKLTIYHFTESKLFSSEEIQRQQVVQTAVKVEAPKEKEKEKSETTKSAGGEDEQKAKYSEEKKRAEKEAQDFDEYAPSGLEFNDSEAITEPNTEKIKDIVAQMPAEAQRVDDLFQQMNPRKYQKNDMEDIGGVHYDKLPQFEPVIKNGLHPDKPRSINDRVKKGINIGVNDRIAFIRHLFDGSSTDYHRVLSQLNTIKSKEEAINFVANIVKPDYNNWEGKEDYEARFLAIIEKKFD